MQPSGSDGAATAVQTELGRFDAAERLSRRVLVFTGLSGIAYLALAMWAGWSEVLQTMFQLGTGAVVLGMAVTVVSYLLRFARWTLILKCMGHAPPLKSSLLIYLGGLALTATPGKVGETVRSALLVRFNVPVAASLAAFFVDRLADLSGVLLLAGLTANRGSMWILIGLAIAALLAGIALPAVAPYAFKQLGRGARQSARRARAATWLSAASDHIRSAWRLRLIPVLLGVAMIAYGLQGLVFSEYALRLWPGLDHVRLLHQFLGSTLVGAASMLPGGIGAMEASLIALLANDGMPLASAVATVIAIRAVTLWFGIALGVASIAWGYNRPAAANGVNGYR